jgi:hypothetical protein
MGIWLACQPFFVLAAEEFTKAPALVESLLGCLPNTVPHPISFNQLEALYTLAGCRNWKAFANRTECFHVQQHGSDLLIIPTKKDGAGFSDLANAVIRCESNDFAGHLLKLLSNNFQLPDSPP